MDDMNLSISIDGAGMASSTNFVVRKLDEIREAADRLSMSLTGVNRQISGLGSGRLEDAADGLAIEAGFASIMLVYLFLPNLSNYTGNQRMLFVTS